jgi:uncharacterized membrane protein YfcA
MLQPGRQADLLEETFRSQGGGQVRMQHLEGDWPVMLEVAGEVDGGHAAVPQLALEDVSLEQGVGELRRNGGHTLNMLILLLGCAGILAGGIAAVSGFGIGSLLTPVLALQVGTKLAVAAVSIPHAVGTAQRFWLLRRHVDWRVVRSFGVTSALGGLAGALLQTRASSRGLEIVFGVLLLLAGTSELTGWMRQVHWGRSAAWLAGAISGALGGLVGNQGGIRTAAMLGYDVPKESFVATATAIALFVDAARLPVYLITQGQEIVAIWGDLLIATCAVILGTFMGQRALARLSQSLFRRVVALLLLGLGVYMLLGGGS